MHAVLMTFEFAEPLEVEDEHVFSEHQALIDRFPGVLTSTMLNDGNSYGYFLVFSDVRDADAYLARREVDAFAQRPGCIDFFVHRFNILDGFQIPGQGTEQVISESVSPVPLP